MIHEFKLSTANIAIALLSCIAASAQGKIAGQVTDGFGAVLPGAKITVSRESEKNVEIGRTTTDYAGNYVLANVPFGEVRLSVTTRGFNRTFSRRLILNSQVPMRRDIVFTLAPCADEEDLDAPTITVEDHAEIVRLLVGTVIGESSLSPGEQKIIFAPHNFTAEWLSAELRSQLAILPREEIQEITERTGSLTYYTITKPRQKGRCVGISLRTSHTVKGQMEDANMSGEEQFYEFRKVDGEWTWLFLASFIS